MGEMFDAANAWFDRKLPPAMEAVGIVIAAKVVNSIGTAYPPASAPGTPPHRRTGNLQAGVNHAESADTTTISSARAEGDPMVPRYLEFGTHKMAARPYMTPVANESPAIVPAVIRRSFSAGATPYAAGD